MNHSLGEVYILEFGACFWNFLNFILEIWVIVKTRALNRIWQLEILNEIFR